MLTSDSIVVGGGPAGSACAWKLKTMGCDVLILDKETFPRPKVCAGWITPKVWDILGITPADYPYALTQFNRIHYSVFGFKIPVITRQYAIRRYEFDKWMISRTHVPVFTHTVKNIVKINEDYIIDNKYRCKYLVGAGGTHCPVFKIFFSFLHQRAEKALIVAVEKEYRCDYLETDCRIWFFDHGLPGYSWYLPKQDGWLNIGLGGKFLKLKTSGKTIMDHWHEFTKKLQLLSLIHKPPQNPKGHTYYLHQKKQINQRENAFIIGDSAGLSTLDMGEGIHAAIASGLMAAKAIAGKKKFNPGSLSKFSLPGILVAGYKK
ncbi:MAG: NAD(P)/FAD-dependent oxidoreductase [Desulfobacula sp.]|jgi:menaquinone-9 beta-reductase|nr:NAD(P)/FAD-dependent oxidoreductase [Desulfobacula sp.]